MTKYIITIESGKHNIAGCDLHILRDNRIIKAKNEEDALNLAFEMPHGLYKYTLRHYGHDPDYQIVINIVKLKSTLLIDLVEKIKIYFNLKVKELLKL